MNESAMTNRLVAGLRQRIKPAEFIKHADRFTSGIPDLSVTYAGATSWWELKKMRVPNAPPACLRPFNFDTLYPYRKNFKRIQLEVAKRLDSTGYRTRYLLMYPGQVYAVLAPSTVERLLARVTYAVGRLNATPRTVDEGWVGLYDENGLAEFIDKFHRSKRRKL